MHRAYSDDGDTLDTLSLIYRPSYIEAYLEHSTPDQTIEEWTRVMGSVRYTEAEIYAPSKIPVHLVGTSANMYAVDPSKEGWFESFRGAIGDALREVGAVRETDKIELEDITGTKIASGVSIDELLSAGSLYATVNGTRLIDTPFSKAAGFGCASKTPITHLPTKTERLHTYIDDLCSRIGELCVRVLSEADTMLDVEKLLCDKNAPDGLSKQVTDLILHTPDVGDLGNFGNVVQTYSDTAVTEALKNAVIGLGDVASDMCDVALDEIAKCMLAHNTVVDSWYQGRAMSAARSSPSTRTIFGAGAENITSRINAAYEEFPSSVALHHRIVHYAFSDNPTLGCHLMHALTKTRRNNLGRRRRKQQTPMTNTEQAPVVDNYHSRMHGEGRHGTYGKYVKGKRLTDVYRRAHHMSGLPPQPGVLIDNWRGDSGGGDSYSGIFPLKGDPTTKYKTDMPHLNTTPPKFKEVKPANKDKDAEKSVYVPEEPSMESPIREYIATLAAEPFVRAVAAPAKAEVPSLEPLAVQQQQPRAEVPSLEPLVRSAPVASKQAMAKTEVPSLEPFVPVASKQPVKTEVPSLEPLVRSVPVASKQPVKTEVPSLEPLVRAVPVASKQPTAARTEVPSLEPIVRSAPVKSRAEEDLLPSIPAFVPATATPTASALPAIPQVASPYGKVDVSHLFGQRPGNIRVK